MTTLASKYGFLFERIHFGDTASSEQQLPQNFTAWKEFDWNAFKLNLLNKALNLAIGILLAIIIIIIGWILIAIISRIFLAIGRRRKWDKTFVGWVNTALKVLLKLVVLIIALNRAGLDMTMMTLLLAAFGVAFSAAVGQIALNFICGVAFMIMKPFKVGDLIEAAGVDGGVDTIGIFCCELSAWDNTIVIVSNSAIFNSVITNWTARSKQRIDLRLSISATEDLDGVRKVIMHTLLSNPYVLKHPRPFVSIDEFDSSRTKLVISPWIRKPEDAGFYPTFEFDIREDILRAIRKAGYRLGCDCLTAGLHIGPQQRPPLPRPKNIHEAEKILEPDEEEEEEVPERNHSSLFHRKKKKGDNVDYEKMDEHDDAVVLDAI